MERIPSGYLTSNEAACELGLTRQRVSALLKQGRIPFKIAGRFRLIKRTDLDKFMSAWLKVGWPPAALALWNWPKRGGV
jgi:excisionase family DNA binding protein